MNNIKILINFKEDICINFLFNYYIDIEDIILYYFIFFVFVNFLINEFIV